MKKLLIVSVLINACFVILHHTCAAELLVGYVYKQNSGKKPTSGVIIKAMAAANPQIYQAELLNKENETAFILYQKKTKER